MTKFNKFEMKFVHIIWSDELEGKTVFFADEIEDLVDAVENNKVSCMGVVAYSGDDRYPFKKTYSWDNQHMYTTPWRFAYYDPQFELKVAHEQGKVIQKKLRLTEDWINILDKNIDWKEFEWNGIELRVKPEEPKPVTNRELARWLAKGNGEQKQSNGGTCIWTDHHYWVGEDNTPAEVLVRKWEDEEWHLPTREYMGLED